MSSIFIFVPSLAAWVRGQPVDRPVPAPTPALDLTLDGSFPLSAVTSARLPQVTLAPGSSTDRGKTPVPTAAGPAPDHPGPPTRKRDIPAPLTSRFVSGEVAPEQVRALIQVLGRHRGSDFCPRPGGL